MLQPVPVDTCYLDRVLASTSPPQKPALLATTRQSAESSLAELQPRTAASPLQSVLADEAPRLPHTPIISDHPFTPHSPSASQSPHRPSALYVPASLNNNNPSSPVQTIIQPTSNPSTFPAIYVFTQSITPRRRRRSPSPVQEQVEHPTEEPPSSENYIQGAARAHGTTDLSRSVAERSPARKRPRLTTRDMRYDPGPSTSNGSQHTLYGSQHAPRQKSLFSNGTNGHSTANGSISPHRNGFSSTTRSSPDSYFGHDREEVTRLLIQSLDDLGYHGAADKLSQESGFEVESAAVAQFRDAVLRGEWQQAEALLLGSEPPDGGGGVSIRNGDCPGLKLVDSANRDQLRFQLKTQKYLELLEAGDSGSAIIVLQKELRPLQPEKDPQLSALSILLGDTDRERLKENARWDGATGQSRQLLLRDLSGAIAPSVMIPQHRLAVLLDQVKQNQISQCLYHNPSSSPSLFSDHLVWDTPSGQVLLKIDHHQHPVTTAAWSPDGQSFVTGSLHGTHRLVLWSIEGHTIHDWDVGYRVQDCAVSPNGKRLVVISSECQIVVYDFETRREEYCILNKSRMTCINVSRDSRQMLVNMANSEIHLIDIDTAEIVKRFLGQQQGEYVIRSTFGGADQNLVISGSEDSRIYIWHKENGNLIETLEGHQIPGCVNVVAWNPTDPCMFASGGDDRKIRILSGELHEIRINMDRQSVYSISVLPSDPDAVEDSRGQIQAQLRDFILEFRLDNAFIYRDHIRENVLVKQYYCDVDIAHLISYNEELAHKLQTQPADTIPLFEAALKQCTHRIVYPSQKADELRLPQHQLLLHSSASIISIRDLNATNISHLVRIPGIVIGASTLSSKATTLAIQCRNCQQSDTVPVSGGISAVSLPRVCSRKRVPGEESDKCPLDPYFVVHEKCQFIDQQILKLQEAPDQVPVGELPRHIKISADRYLANRVVPGTRCTIMGVFSIYQNKEAKGSGNSAVAIRTPYLRAVGISSDVDHTTKGHAIFSEEEEQEFLEMSRRPDLYDLFASCIAPSIYGNQDIKKAIACLLLGGSKKILPDGMKLRGDINVLLLGDPGTAKSQLLKFVEKVAPIAIYTSGKGSSAAGLTASVQRDTNTREFYLEGGAMVLADGGVVCIDEFDKMRDEDRVAIHEAMEQQTISIAKAGITTILNARTSVLAAANPIFGRYDDLKTPGENIDFQTTILSRFDMIFIVRDEHDRGRDERIARHVMGIQMGGRGVEEQTEAEISVERMKRYISYCKSRCAPRLSPSAAEALSSHFVSLRRQIHAHESTTSARSSIPITIRQLEAITRIAESLAKLSLSVVATEAHVDEAMRLFLASTMDAATSSTSGGAMANVGRELQDESKKVEEELRRRLPVGWSTGLGALRREFCEGRGFGEAALGRALGVLQRREVVQMRNGGAMVFRCAA
ncbi:MAG: hypothetical protein LQ344_004815 [Seirophora lacunosa]|nr:MAG: hypothetical protein LQ344_004815 [Seirophora lacunosa]